MIVIPLSEFGLMTVHEVARHHRCQPKCVWRWIAEDRLPALPVSRCVLIRRVDCETFKKPGRGRKKQPGV